MICGKRKSRIHPARWIRADDPHTFGRQRFGKGCFAVVVHMHQLIAITCDPRGYTFHTMIFVSVISSIA